MIVKSSQTLTTSKFEIDSNDARTYNSLICSAAFLELYMVIPARFFEVRYQLFNFFKRDRTYGRDRFCVLYNCGIFSNILLICSHLRGLVGRSRSIINYLDCSLSVVGVVKHIRSLFFFLSCFSFCVIIIDRCPSRNNTLAITQYLFLNLLRC